MASADVRQLKERAGAAWANLRRQLQGMESYLERSDAPGEWTAREVLSHLLGEPGWEPVAQLKTFAFADLPVIEIGPGDTHVTAERERMTLPQFVDALAAQQRSVLDYLESLSDVDLQRKARIPLFKTFMGTDEITLPIYAGAMFDYHWNDHAGQVAKIRKAVGLPEAG
ncbi:MAG TPA: DinB family protein [Methylomirabilota bacterium]|jgi:hypothetical protein|nr:DinB family protein [Methylomirabilota bacterium]